MSFDLSFSKEEVETLYYSLAQAEMMWRTRSNNAVSYLTYDVTPEDHETECRAEMKRYRVMQKKLDEMLPVGFWDYDTEFADGVE
jgi:hypothetical protein|tara:strand:+ start:777 stop:1031 length:255 start_codon:yes stop_codon:yes gene_type:complete